MACPVDLADVDLFGVGAQEHWYDAYEILPVPAAPLRTAQRCYREGIRHQDHYPSDEVHAAAGELTRLIAAASDQPG